jgi:hypothetical protein
MVPRPALSSSLPVLSRLSLPVFQIIGMKVSNTSYISAHAAKVGRDPGATWKGNLYWIEQIDRSELTTINELVQHEKVRQSHEFEERP